MRSWKAVLGVGAACAACCAVPLLGGAAVLMVGTTTLAAAGSALLACANEFGPLAAALFGLAVLGLGGGLVWWTRRSRRQAQLATGCRGGCGASQG